MDHLDRRNWETGVAVSGRLEEELIFPCVILANSKDLVLLIQGEVVLVLMQEVSVHRDHHDVDLLEQGIFELSTKLLGEDVRQRV